MNTTGAAPAATNMFEVLQPSTTANTVGVWAEHTGAIAGGTGYALQAIKSGASLNNIAAYLSATGATNNYALIIPASSGTIGLGTITPDANTLLSITPTTNTIRHGIYMPYPGSGTISSTAYGINIPVTTNQNVRGFLYTNSTAGSGVFYGVGSELSSTNIVSGYSSYRNSSGLSYGVYGINGTNAAYATNANTWAAFLQGRTVISSESSPSSPLGTDLEIRNTTTGAGNPATLSMRQTTSNSTSGTVLTDINFGDNYQTGPQAQIQILRDAAGGAGDLPTSIAFSTTPDASVTLTERVRIINSGNVGIASTLPSAKLNVYESNESATLTNFTQNLGSSGILLTTNYTVSAYTPGLFWSTSDNNPTKPKAGIWLLEDGTGTDLYFGTSNAYATGITNNGLMLDQAGNVGIGTTTTSYKLDVSGDIRSTNKIWANANGASYFRGGDDAELWDVNVANTLGVYGVQNSAIATIRLGSGAADISGNSGNVGIGTTSPGAKLEVAGQVKITGGSPGVNKVLYSDATGLANWGGALLYDNNILNCQGSTTQYVDFPHWTPFTVIIGSHYTSPPQIADGSAVENDGSIRITFSGDKNLTGSYAEGVLITTFGQANTCSLYTYYAGAHSSGGTHQFRVVCDATYPVGTYVAFVKVIW